MMEILERAEVATAIIFFIMLLLSTYFIRELIDEISKKTTTEDQTTEITTKAIIEDDEFALICRALSDSMNYKPNDRFNEKWNLLLKLKTIEHSAQKEREDKE